ncbi:hypothetical protein Q31b_43070 [Novipirellula aureliae]|uniref:DUF104 domain-containing protein n=1 Tax=Novipirellula aureliae TaxID=2527966 RepID=A0A5C6DRY1_9BACT|nr:hypothetical protein [Novipirellula aureliae]TWU37519.1 hypothetical protein Q31b_43070 [Novipirellula aureliae]
MTDDITGYFDGKAIVPDQPLKLELGQKLRVRIETVGSDEIEQIEDNIPELAKLAIERAYKEALASGLSFDERSSSKDEDICWAEWFQQGRLEK